VSSENQALPMALVAALLLRLGFTDAHLIFVKPAMRPWLLVAGGVLAGLALTRFLASRSSDEPGDVEGDGEGDGDGAGDGLDHRDADVTHAGAHPEHVHGGGWLPWLLAVPFAAVMVVPSAPLGSFLAARQPVRAPTPPPESSVEGFPPLARPVGGAYELTLAEFTSRALYDAERQLESETVRLTGFVTPSPGGGNGHDGGGQDAFLLTRIVLSCCAGDGAPVQVAVRGLDQPVPAADTWLIVEGIWRPHPSGDEPDIPVLEVSDLREIPQPSDPYER
jgi:uncharacterized repeat protein (TIGR03943 family)